MRHHPDVAFEDAVIVARVLVECWVGVFDAMQDEQEQRAQAHLAVLDDMVSGYLRLRFEGVSES
ncbi:hypothetical protein PUV47_16770 [Pseudovibrio exalbescens]|uniref:hypothetical protein n=1 Tax=Pseudovibrio exalbescens TaxID=197461 RepID=UPI002365E5A8|nr:hypothetical protein [Pseudovibrio exalbescens]MDD7911586.1 hypothetical protein [Pseudovibrio exalbescens]